MNTMDLFRITANKKGLTVDELIAYQLYLINF